MPWSRYAPAALLDRRHSVAPDSKFCAIALFVREPLAEINKIILGQEGLKIGLLANGHILIEGVLGLAKTRR